MTKLNKKVATVSSDKVKTYKLPDGNMVSVGSERFCCPEVLSQSPDFGCASGCSFFADLGARAF